MIVKNDCRHFQGDVPCGPHKDEGVHCADCSYYDQIKMRILIIKLGAIGDVIRTPPLLHKLKAEHPDAWVAEGKVVTAAERDPGSLHFRRPERPTGVGMRMG